MGGYMSLARPTERKDHRTTVLEHLGDGRRRRILDALLDRSAPLAVSELAARVVEDERSDSPGRSALRIELAHVHLPALEDVGLVAWDRDAGTVTTTDDPALADPALRRIVAREGDNWDDVVACLANERRRAVAAALEGRGPTSRGTIARAVAEREADGEPSPDAVEELRIALHHVHLPKLADAGLVDYDGEEGVAVSRPHRAVEPVMAFCDED